jgi:hypothetical protein
MRDQERIQAAFSNFCACALQPSFVVHGESLSQA